MNTTWNRTFRIAVLFLMLISIIPAAAQDQVTHVVQPGENLFRIALRYGVDMNTLAQTNSITDATRIFSGQTLVIPGLSAPASEPESTETVNPLVATPPVVHVVQRGESLNIIAQRYNVTIEQLLAGNNIANANRIYPGQALNIWSPDLSSTYEAPPATEAPAVVEEPVPAVVETASVYHTVQAGEYLSSIARRYNISWTRIAEANNITDPNRVFAGMQLMIPGTSGAPASAQSAEPPPQTEQQQFGIVQDPGPGARVGTGREIVVILSTQMTYAYEDGLLKKASLVSTGLPATPTVQGDYKIYRRYDSQTMSGPGYYLPGVQWVMYFYQGYALHGTYWHTNFGQPMSHGCVNLTNEDARWFYDFASIGTPVHVRWA